MTQERYLDALRLSRPSYLTNYVGLSQLHLPAQTDPQTPFTTPTSPLPAVHTSHLSPLAPPISRHDHAHFLSLSTSSSSSFPVPSWPSHFTHPSMTAMGHFNDFLRNPANATPDRVIDFSLAKEANIKHQVGGVKLQVGGVKHQVGGVSDSHVTGHQYARPSATGSIDSLRLRARQHAAYLGLLDGGS